MTDDRAEVLSHRLCDPISAQTERLSEVVLDIQHPSSQLKQCSQTRKLMTQRLLDYGLGPYSVMGICNRLTGSSDTSYGLCPDQVSSAAAIATHAYLYAVMARELVIESKCSESERWFENLETSRTVSDPLDQFRELNFETNDEFAILQIVFSKEDRQRIARNKIREKRREQEKEKALERDKTKAILIDEATRLKEKGVPSHNLAAMVKKATGIPWHVNTIRKVLQDSGHIPRRLKKK